MKALLLLASLFCFGGMPAGAQEEEAEDQGFKVYDRREVIYISNLDGSGERQLTEGYHPALSPDRNHMAFGKRADLYLMDLEMLLQPCYALGDGGRGDPEPGGGSGEAPVAGGGLEVAQAFERGQEQHGGETSGRVVDKGPLR